MTMTHELGHIFGGWSGGATLVDADLRPWHLPYSIHSPDPSPLLTLWSGPIVGVAIPIVAAVIIRWRSAWFVADFCILANGTYLALAWLAGDPHLDTSRLLESGASSISLATYCVLTISLGYVRFRNDCVMLLSENQPTNHSQESESADTASR
ncbi:hypothetical protein [Rhodopirellula bahusiensis]|uniref:Uncharacterized protein n=1 Tax=Rhodopirellula bahusiensis TaxID=2014065 RepID=A0A2G1W516_9BACT|nr:hypothetical protein [Rhodopirellula bahusiensis]PHQ34137.1 hypothetical protein CEE69_17460 [Rhodopirellula bahusiensis]